MSEITPGLETNPFHGRTIDYLDLKAGLQAIQPNLVFDEGSGWCTYQMSDGKMRVGIFHNQRFICACERGTIPEFTLYDEWTYEKVPASPKEVLEEPDGAKAWFEEIWVMPHTDPKRFRVLDAWIGAETVKTQKYPQANVLIQRIEGSIVISAGFKIVKMPTRALRIGWREVFDYILSGPNGVSRRQIEEKFSVNLQGPSQADLMLDTAMAVCK